MSVLYPPTLGKDQSTLTKLLPALELSPLFSLRLLLCQLRARRNENDF